jgi:hypothetical protein
MTMVRICVATAALITLAISGITASAPRTALAEARPAAVQAMASPANVVPTVDDGAATDWLRGGPRPTNVCKPPTVCCEWVLPHICGQCC